MSKLVKAIIEQAENGSPVLKAGVLMIIFILLNHWCACIMHYISEDERIKGNKPNFVSDTFALLTL
jgi:hypothetical protein